MKRYTSYVLATLLVAGITGCGTDSADKLIEDGIDTLSSLEKRTVIVERGAVYDANVTDSEGNVATQQDGNNTYVFDVEPVYPITAEGGWIDVDGDGNMTEGVDAILDINLTSYINIVTPTTTYLADENETVRIDKLIQLANEANTTTEDLLKPPSESTKHSIYVLNAVYEKLMEKKNEHSKAHIAIGDILDRYYSYKSNDNTDENASSEEVALAVEEQAMDNLSSKGYVKKLDKDDIDKFNKHRKDKNDVHDDFDYGDENATSAVNDNDDVDDDSKGKGHKDSGGGSDGFVAEDNNTSNVKGNDHGKPETSDDDVKGKPDNENGKPEKAEKPEKPEADHSDGKDRHEK